MDLDFSQFQPSLALEAILEYDQEKIRCRTSKRPAPYLHLEALAQSCGLHLRYIHNFRIQAFLVSMADLVYPLDQTQAAWSLEARLQAQTSTAAHYVVSVHNGPTCKIIMGYQGIDMVDTYFEDRFLWLSTRSSNI